MESAEMKLAGTAADKRRTSYPMKPIFSGEHGNRNVHEYIPDLPSGVARTRISGVERPVSGYLGVFVHIQLDIPGGIERP
ncbi:hypothetical protein [Nocardia cyriacigeorgica]|uniref:hypothetical protein n=1 Tax=Nocardia cyriacigeorgica TaxID=135487 RepID=UPI0024924D62|nr:hypothetical protein [Nocardia cyriacigeorgica]